MRWLLRAVAAVVIAIAVWLVGFRGGGSGDTPPISAPTTVGEVADGGPIYLTEVRSRPDYRLASYDPASGVTAPVHVVSEFGVISSVAASPDDDWLALGYTADYRVPGAGIYAVRLPSAATDGVVSDEPELVAQELDAGIYEDLAFGPDAAVLWATVSYGDDSASVVEVDTDTGTTRRTIEHAVDPAPVGGDRLAYLALEDDGSRRSIHVLDLATDSTETIGVLDGRYDLDHLLADPTRNRLLFTALLPEDEPRVQLGQPAGAHGSHAGPSQWLAVDLETGEVTRPIDHDPVTVREATLLDNGLVAFSTKDGLAILSDDLTTVIESSVIVELAS